MRISSDQMKSFYQGATSDFETRLMIFLRERFDDATEMPDAELSRGIHEQVERAETYGLLSEKQVASYVTTAWLLGQDFDQKFPKINAVLRSPMYEPDEKADFVLEHAAQLFDALAGAR